MVWAIGISDASHRVCLRRGLVSDSALRRNWLNRCNRGKFGIRSLLARVIPTMALVYRLAADVPTMAAAYVEVLWSR